MNSFAFFDLERPTGCIVEPDHDVLYSNKNNIADILNGIITPLIEIEPVDYKRNQGATYCKRDPSIIDTIVIHHTETFPTDTPLDINDMHLDNGPPDDRWLMIGYNFLMNSAYQDCPSCIETRAYEGRPIDISGAHAGSEVFIKTSAENHLRIAQTGIKCGNEQIGFKDVEDRDLYRGNKVKANHISLGVALIGNYAPFHPLRSVSGYPFRQKRYPSKVAIEGMGKMICELQRQHPNITRVTVHGRLRNTDCPGTVEEKLDDILAIAKEYGCTFEQF